MQRRPTAGPLSSFFHSTDQSVAYSQIGAADDFSEGSLDNTDSSSIVLIKRSPSRSPSPSSTYRTRLDQPTSLLKPSSSPLLTSSRSQSPSVKSLTRQLGKQASIGVRLSLIVVTLASLFLLLYIGTHLKSINRSIIPFFQADLARQTNQLNDPLPSCSLINVNLTHNLLYHQWMVQNPHANADCSAYPITGHCIYEPTEHSFDPSASRSTPSVQPLRPKWLVFRMRNGSGGLADRMKGLLGVLSLALLTGRAFAIDTEPSNPITVTHSRSILDWRTFDSLPLSLQKSAKRLDVSWFDAHWRPIYKDHTDWAETWAEHDVVTVTYNYNGFVDLMDNRSLYDRYRTFGFHSWSEKGDLDLYWECLMDFTFRYSPAVLQPLNALLTSINRKPLKSWQDIKRDVPTLSQLITLQSNNEFILSNTTSEQRWNNYQSQFYYDQPSDQPSSLTSSQQSTNQSHQLFCVQLRMGSNAKFSAESNQSSLSFKDSESFLNSDQFAHIFTQMEQYIKQSTQPSNNISLFLTSESPEFESHIPASWRGLQRLVAPGRTGHIDKVESTDTALLHEAAINTVVTHFLIGECDAAAVSISGFGPTALWRSRNRHAPKPLQDSVYVNKFLIKKENGDLFDYRHMRGSVGREYDFEYKPREAHIIKTGEALFNETTMKMFSAESYGKFQASAQLPIEPPDDPMCTRFGFH